MLLKCTVSLYGARTDNAITVGFVLLGCGKDNAAVRSRSAMSSRIVAAIRRREHNTTVRSSRAISTRIVAAIRRHVYSVAVPSKRAISTTCVVAAIRRREYNAAFRSSGACYCGCREEADGGDDTSAKMHFRKLVSCQLIEIVFRVCRDEQGRYLPN